MHTIKINHHKPVSVGDLCSAYLKTLTKRKTINTKLGVSHLKNILERHLQQSIPLDVFVSAARQEGFMVKETKEEVYLNVSHSEWPDMFEVVDADRRNRMISEAAYYIAERRGFKTGFEWSDWLSAERKVDTMLSS